MATDGSFAITKVVRAPVGAVWAAWTDPDVVRTWWGPIGFSCPRAEINFAVGQASFVTMRAPDGTEIHNRWTYRLIQPKTLIKFESSFCDTHGTVVAPGDVGLPPDVPDVVPHIVTLTARGDGQTVLTVAESGYQPGPVLDLSQQGQAQCLDKLARSVARRSR